ncbi:MAG: PAS domain-containing sensor histidine kinase [Chloroflexi bacterium]|nr:PAS domain-containing sensor histidine kinase [Chloroflexota bacterium]
MNGKSWIYPFRPRIRDRHFWAVQGLVAVVAGFHLLAESLRLWESWQIPDYSLTFVPITLLYIPMVYAALNFGFAGSTATALLCIALTVPLPLLYHKGLDAATELFQLGIVAGIASFVGHRVDREQAARQQAEAAGAAFRASEMKYRGLFESSPIPILVTDPAGTIFEANPAAGGLFGKDPADLRNATIADLVRPAGSRKLIDLSHDARQQEDYLTITRANGSQVYLEPTLTRISDSQGNPVIEIQLRDVTEERQQRAGLRAFAATILRAQEEERRRIAQELHDESVQQLILLCRQLDLVEGVGAPLSPLGLGELRAARRTAETVAEGLRDFARTLRPLTLDDLGLVTSVRRLVEDCAERAKVDGEVTIVGEERRLAPDLELCLFRIAQEALRNVERHARASHVSVRMVFSECRVGLEVVDNGIGFSPPTASDFAAGGHLGLLGMRERAKSLGGTLEITSNRQDGTRVALLIPETGAGCHETGPED